MRRHSSKQTPRGYWVAKTRHQDFKEEDESISMQSDARSRVPWESVRLLSPPRVAGGLLVGVGWVEGALPVGRWWLARQWGGRVRAEQRAACCVVTSVDSGQSPLSYKWPYTRRICIL